MKKKRSTALSLAIIIMLTFFSVLLPAKDIYAGGAEVELTYSKNLSLSYMKGKKNFLIYMGKKLKSTDAVTVKSSKPSVIKKVSPFYSNWPSFTVKKAGKATLTIIVRHKNGKKNTYKTKITAYKFKNPFKSCKIGGKDFKSSFNKFTMPYLETEGSPDQLYVDVNLNSGWKIKKLRYRADPSKVDDSAYVNITNHAYFTLPVNESGMKTGDGFQIVVYNKSKKLTEEFWVNYYPG
jgi:hypothetical protein